MQRHFKLTNLKNIVFFIIIILFLQACGLNNNHHKKHGSDKPEYPELATAPNDADITTLTNYLVANYTNENDRVRIIYLWVIQNIKYAPSVETSHLNWHYVYNKDRHSANCNSFSAIFSQMLDVANIKNDKILGLGINHEYAYRLRNENGFKSYILSNSGELYSLNNPDDEFERGCQEINYNQILCLYYNGQDYNGQENVNFGLGNLQNEQNKQYDSAKYLFYDTTYYYSGLSYHAWNVVYYNNNTTPYMFDTTWKYYKRSPKAMIGDHYPQYDSDQFLDSPLSLLDFVNQF